MHQVVRLSLVSQTDNRARLGQRSSEHRLQEGVRCDLEHDRVGRNVLEGLVKADRRRHVVDVVLGRVEATQLRVPFRLRYRRTDPALRPWTILTNYLRSIISIYYSFGPFYGAIAVPSVTRCRCCRGHRYAGGVRQWRRATVATPGEWQCGVRRLAVANGSNIFQMLLVLTTKDPKVL